MLKNSETAFGTMFMNALGAPAVYWHGQGGRSHSSIVDRQAAIKTIESLRAADALYGEFK